MAIKFQGIWIPTRQSLHRWVSSTSHLSRFQALSLETYMELRTMGIEHQLGLLFWVSPHQKHFGSEIYFSILSLRFSSLCQVQLVARQGGNTIWFLVGCVIVEDDSRCSFMLLLCWLLVFLGLMKLCLSLSSIYGAVIHNLDPITCSFFENGLD